MDEIKLRIDGSMLDKKVHEFFVKKEMRLEEYLVLSYHCQGIRRQLFRRKPFFFLVLDGGQEIPLICYDDIVIDNQLHTLMVKAPVGDCHGCKVTFAADRRPQAEFIIHEFYTCDEEQLPSALCRLETEKSRAYVPLDLTGYYNGAFCHSDPECIIDGGRFFDSEYVNICEIPFRFSGEDNNIICPSLPPSENEDVIINFGVPAKRRLCRPVSRNSQTEILVDKPVKELFFILALNGKRHQRWGFSTDEVILGGSQGEVFMPLSITDTEGFMVEILYKNGNRDTAFPLNLALHRHIVQGDMGIYAVPADGSQVDKIVFHNRLLDTDCSIVAVTVNADQERQYPEMLIPKKSDPVQRAVSKCRKMSLDQGILHIENQGLVLDLDVEHGLNLIRMESAYTPKLRVGTGALLRLRDEANQVSSELMLKNAVLSEEKASAVYEWNQAVEFTAMISLGEKDQVLFELNMKNISDKVVKTGVLFPCFSEVEYADWNDSWYFFPKLQNLNSNETVFLYEESAPSFAMQFMDVYSPSQQGGISLTTQERELTVRKYGLEKDEKGIRFFVEYPFMYSELQPDEEREASPALLTVHTGDWRESYRIYKKWLDSWYEPYHCQDKQWYRECFWLLAEIRDFFETTEFTKMPIWYDKEKKEFQFQKILEEQKEITGYYPDILHLWGWTWREEWGSMQWGNFGSSDYDFYDGMQNFREALHAVKDEKGVNVSLYLHPTLLSDTYPQAEKFYPRYKVINDQGEFITCGKHTYRMCHAAEEWRNHAVEMYPRIYKDLEIPLLYVDEFSLRVENRCYGNDHGHSVPSNLLKTDRDFITRLKDAMPPEVVLYGEYTAVDVNARYIDCNISYYIIDTVMDMIETAWRGRDGDDRLSPVITDLYRFAFPKIVQLVLPMAMRNISWHPQKFIFFNGEAIYDSFWDCEESRGQEFTVKAYGIKKKYADCFSSDTPETMIDTLTPAVCANCFPGKGRTLYTLYNRAYSTYRGKILTVPHEDGNLYYDAWNEVVLMPEIRDGFAEIALTIDAQQMGCLCVEMR